MLKVKVRDEALRTYDIKVTRKYVRVKWEDQEAFLPVKVCDDCLRQIVEGELQKGINFVVVGGIVYVRVLYLRPPKMKCQVCGRRTADLVFNGILDYRDGEWFYIKKNGQEKPFNEVFKKREKEENSANLSVASF